MNNLVTLSLVLLMSPIVKANTLPESCGVGSYLNKIVVSTAAELKTALSKANPGDYIQLNPGSYKGRFVIDRGGSTLNPITLCGSKGAVLDGEDIRQDTPCI